MLKEKESFVRVQGIFNAMDLTASCTAVRLWILFSRGRYGMRVVIMLVGLMSIGAQAGSFVCRTNIDNVLLYGSGAVNVRHEGRGDYTYICNLNSDWKGVSVTTCAMWASLLINAHENDKRVVFYYRQTDEYDRCAELPTYSGAPAPVYIGTMEQ